MLKSIILSLYEGLHMFSSKGTTYYAVVFVLLELIFLINIRLNKNRKKNRWTIDHG